jgi:predicted histidine transporter YuiF (NhaC family)
MIESVLTLVLAVAIATERVVEVIKPLYLKVKNFLTKNNYSECDKTEKIIMSVLAGPVICVVLGIGINISGIPVIAQSILLGLFASVGSNAIHLIITTLTALKDATEGLKPDDKAA